MIFIESKYSSSTAHLVLDMKDKYFQGFHLQEREEKKMVDFRLHEGCWFPQDFQE